MAWRERQERSSKGEGLVRLGDQRVKSYSGNQLLPAGRLNKPVFTEWNTEEAIRAGYKASTWVYACITKRMKAVASVPMVVQKEIEPDVWEDAGKEHELSQLLAKPSPFFTMQDINETIVAHLDLGGNALISKVRVRNKPKELWVLEPDRVRPVMSATEYISRYEYKLDGSKKDLKPTDVVHFRYVDPSNPVWGISPLMAGGKTVDMEVEAVNWNKSAMQNRAVPDGMIAMKTPLTEKQFIEANHFLEGQLMGAANTRRPFVMGYDAKYERFSLSPAEMDFIESRKLTREEICAMFATPPPLVGIYDNATLANIETARVIFWLDTIVPLLDDLAAIWNHALVPDFGPNLRIVFDTSKVQAMQSLLADKVKTAKLLFDMGVPMNEINQRLGLGFDEIVGGDTGYLPGTLIPTTESV